ncbi:C39 family peptidase [Micromonospora sp. DT233]|uniref:C39 family peptidase n=1 Tax=Micromonospora sp. DT233 TaxID=3393432 RepID=UPI003CF9FAFA
MNAHLKQKLRRFAIERPYQVVAGSAAALVLASGTGLLLTGGDDAAPRTTPAAEVGAVSPTQAGPAASASPSATGSPSATPDPDLTGTADPSRSTADKATESRTMAARAKTAAKPAAARTPSAKSLDYDYAAQINYYYCGPAAVRNALSASGVETTQDGLAAELGTTEMGTNSAEDTTRVLNEMVPGNPYRTRAIPGGAADSAQTERMRTDVVAAIADGRGVVANVAGDVVDLDGGWHSFPGGHYVAVVGYRNDGRTVRIADSADASLPSYWISITTLADWTATRGYSA